MLIENLKSISERDNILQVYKYNSILLIETEKFISKIY